MKRLLITVVLLAVIGAAGWFGFQQFQERQAALDEEPTYETVSVERGATSSTVSATGSIEPEAEVALSFRASGRVEQVLVSVGQPVEAGQLLAQLDVTDASLALEQAEVSLQISRAQLDKLENPPAESDVIAAQANITAAQASVASSEAALASAQASYRDLIAGASPQAVQLEQNTIALEVAQAQLALTQKGADEAQIAAALGVPVLLTGQIFNLYRTLQQMGLGEEGNHALVKALENLSGVQIA